MREPKTLRLWSKVSVRMTGEVGRVTRIRVDNAAHPGRLPIRVWFGHDRVSESFTRLELRVIPERLPYPGQKRPRPKLVKVARRQDFKCAICGLIVDITTQGRPNSGTIDHITPRARGGSDAFRNLQLACQPCNQSKGDSLPTSE